MGSLFFWVSGFLLGGLEKLSVYAAGKEMTGEVWGWVWLGMCICVEKIWVGKGVYFTVDTVYDSGQAGMI